MKTQSFIQKNISYEIGIYVKLKQLFLLEKDLFKKKTNQNPLTFPSLFQFRQLTAIFPF